MPKRLVIGCGYVGLRVARAWQSCGDEVFALTRSPDTAARWQAEGLFPILGDVTQPETLAALPAVDTCLYAVGYDRSSGLSQREVYVTGLGHVVDRLAGQVRHWIYVSSTSVYGENAGEWVTAETACHPTSSSGQVCLAAEQLLRDRLLPEEHAATGVTLDILRFAGIYGPDRLIARVAQLRAGESLAVSPEGWLNLIHVDDGVAAILACEATARNETSTSAARTFLICDDQPIPRRDFYTIMARLIGAPPPRFVTEGLPEAERTGRNKRCSNELARQQLPWTPRFPTIETGLPHALQATSRSM